MKSVTSKKKPPVKARVMPEEAIRLEYWNGQHWIPCGKFCEERIAWMSLSGDDLNYRTVNSSGKVITDKRPTPSAK